MVIRVEEFQVKDWAYCISLKDAARAVIAIGIPYPNFKDVEVSLKRKFNDTFCKKKSLLNGSEWYDVQAFRGLCHQTFSATCFVSANH
jgi:hypothetical protein